MQLRVVLGSGLILGALMVVAMTTFYANQEVYLSVDELLTSSPGVETRRLQVRGDVDYASVVRPAEGLEMRFTLRGRDGGVPVVYHGIVPDSFDIAESVTVAGRMGDDGAFVADQLFVQCPSKYEAAPPGSESASTRG